MAKREVSEAIAAVLLSEFFDKHLRLGTGNKGQPQTAAQFAEKSGLLPSTISELRNRKRLPSRPTLSIIEGTFFPNKSRLANDPAHLEWKDVLDAIANDGLPAGLDPDDKRFSLRQGWDFVTRPITNRTLSVVRSAPDDPGVGSLHRDQINIHMTGKTFILPMPDWFVTAVSEDPYMRDRYDMHDAIDLTGNPKLRHLFETVPIRHFPEMVAYHSAAYAHDVLEALHRRTTYPPYNKKKVGLHGYQQSQRRQRHEGVFLDLDLYETDYFTHRVMRRVLHDIRLTRPGLFSDDPSPYDAIPFLRYFTTSFGINIIATTQEQRGRRFYMTRLSARQGNNNQQGLWHVSANEGLSLEDVSQDRIDIGHVVERALLEELGAGYREPGDETHYLEFGFDQRNLEPYISCLVHLSTDREVFYRNKAHMARDDRREFQDIKDFPFSEQAIIQMLIDEPAGVDGFTSYSLNILDSILVRNLAPRRHD